MESSYQQLARSLRWRANFLYKFLNKKRAPPYDDAVLSNVKHISLLGKYVPSSILVALSCHTHHMLQMSNLLLEPCWALGDIAKEKDLREISRLLQLVCLF